MELIGVKSKDMPVMLVKKKINFCINYEIMMKNNPITSKCLKKVKVTELKLALLTRPGNNINPKQWTPKHKGSIACEYPISVNNYFRSIGVQ